VRLVAVFLGVAALLAFAASRTPTPAAPSTPASHVSQYLGMMAFLWGLFWFARVGLRKHGTTVRELLGGRWRSPLDVGVSLAWAIGFLVIARGVLSLATTGLAHVGQSVATESAHTMVFLGPHGFVECALWVLLSVSAGFCEEFVFRGYLQRQFAALTRNRAAGLLISALIFGAGHFYQGWRSATVITLYGVLFGLLAHVTRTLRPGMLAHAIEDITSGLRIGA
jgi:membrane protease YdiL (CAAX protease family)